ncbi:MAG: DivIVA domain-containing protein [Deltaproteobacteria bacterium]|nr:MAG: DivIVA domain-containing protein [Deltaproteobacteria bacterium]
MRLTPLDIQNHRFATRIRGLDPEDVKQFLRVVAQDFESLVQENGMLHERVRQLEAKLEEHVANENSLKQTLVTAQSVSDDLRNTAVKEAEVLIGEAEVKAEKIIDAAHRRLSKLTEDIRQMKMLRTRIGAAVRTTIETHLSLLEGLAEDDPEDPLLDGKVAYLTRTKTALDSEGGS